VTRRFGRRVSTDDRGQHRINSTSNRGTLLDGTEFDSSARGDKPATFVVKASLPGWRQALLLMPVGSKWELALPPRLAYGPRGTGLGVGPQATVIFELELLAIAGQKEVSR
jgi:FKBP-type peptidyl-prolyl cis-trans isomerase FklB